MFLNFITLASEGSGDSTSVRGDRFKMNRQTVRILRREGHVAEAGCHERVGGIRRSKIR